MTLDLTPKPPIPDAFPQYPWLGGTSLLPAPRCLRASDAEPKEDAEEDSDDEEEDDLDDDEDEDEDEDDEDLDEDEDDEEVEETDAEDGDE